MKKSHLFLFLLAYFIGCSAGAAFHGSKEVRDVGPSPIIGFNGTSAGCGVGDASDYLYNPTTPVGVQSPSPLSLVYSVDDSSITFGLSVYYVPTNSRYVITFQDFFSAGGTLTTAGTCDNYVPSVYNSLSPSQWWGHLPNALGIENATAPLFTANGPNGVWTPREVDCSTVAYSTTFTLTQLYNCRTHSGSRVVTTRQAADQTITTTGTVFVTLIESKAEDLSEDDGYLASVWSTDFTIVAQSSSIATLGVGGDIIVYIIATYAYIVQNTGVLHLEVIAYVTASNYTSPQVSLCYQPPADQGEDDAQFVLDNGQEVSVWWQNGCPSYNEVYDYRSFVFEFQPVTPGTFSYVYDGSYTFSFSVSACDVDGDNCVPQGSVGFEKTIYMSVNPPDTVDMSFETGITAYLSNGLTTFDTLATSNVYTDGQRLCLIDAITNVAPDEMGDYTLTIQDVYLCNSQVGSPMLYDGVSHFGCLNQTRLATLRKNGNDVTNYNRDYYEAFGVSPPSTDGQYGYCLYVRQSLYDPLTGNHWSGMGTGQYIQIRSQIDFRNAKRSVGSGSGSSTSVVIIVVTAGGTEVVSSTSHGTISVHPGSEYTPGAIVGIVVGSLVGFILVVSCIVLLVKRREHPSKKYSLI